MTSDHTHDRIIATLEQHTGLLHEIREQTTKTNGRVNKHDTAIAVLRWVVFVAGGGLVGAVVYLYRMHLAGGL